MADTLKVYSRIWIKKGGENSLGYGRVELLRLIKEYGSISKASKMMRMSYKAAWDDLNQIKELEGKPLIESNNGGKGGGGSVLTKEGERAIEVFDELEELKSEILGVFGDAKNLDELSSRIKLLRKELDPLLKKGI